jgi:hypothetical protein
VPRCIPEPFDVTWTVLATLGLSHEEIQRKREDGFTMMPRSAEEMYPER